ncbi:MAG: hypothetical protein F6K09_32335 [Merismopedia sp. SIO2A8]|nr:hypothetical protein [Symploca sp. SIO2B6]NET53189.1 hypothetical protein [Merismopedia sp. SIO2A8]
MFKPTKSISILTFVLLMGCASPDSAPQSANYSSNISASTPTTTAETTNSATLPDTIIIPGERIGSVTSNTSRQQLTQLFGEQRLTDEQVHMGEGFTQPGTRVNLGSDLSFTIVWADPNRLQVQEVRNLGSDWQTPQGIGVGTTFTQLQEQLGSFEIYGLAWDYGGTVLLQGTKLAEYEQLLILRLQAAPDAAQKSPEDYQAVLGDSTFSSSNPHMGRLNLKVGEIIVQLAPNTQ